MMISFFQSFRFKVLLALTLVPLVTFLIFFLLIYQPYREQSRLKLQELDLSQIANLKSSLLITTEKYQTLNQATYRESLESNFLKPSATFNTNSQFLYFSVTDLKDKSERYIKTSPEFSTSHKKLIPDLLYGENQYLVFDDQKFLLTKHTDSKRQLLATALFDITTQLNSDPESMPYFIISGSQLINLGDTKETLSNEIKQKVINLSATTSQGTFQAGDSFVYYDKVKDSSTTLIGIRHKDFYKAQEIFDLKQLSFLFASLFIFILMIGLFFSKKLSSSFNILIQGTKEISAGNFNYIFPIYGKDEIAHLASQFTDMAEQLSLYLRSYEKKVLLERGLQTAQFIQNSILPSSEGSSGPFPFSSFYRPASSIGGDWWSHTSTAETVKFFLGDATGHGPSAALATSAASATFANLHEENSLIEDLEKFNNSLNKTFHGNIYMTMVIVKLTKEKVYFSSAAHESIVLIKKDNTIEHHDHPSATPRIGEKLDRTFQINEFPWEPGDSLLIHSDGIFELDRVPGKPYSSSSLERFLKKNINTSLTTHGIRNQILKEIIPRVDKENQPDDILLVVIKNN